MRYIVFLVALASAANAHAAKSNQVDPAMAAENARQASGPCHNAFCSDRDAQALQDAWASGETTDEQRAKLNNFVSTNTANGTTNWAAARLGYFQWRAESLDYKYDPNAKPISSLPKAPRDFRAMRVAAEDSIKSRLIDPSSAQFEWPFGFQSTSWKPFLSKTISGWVVCGNVNAKNRLGGYTGAAAFVVVLSDANDVIFSDVDPAGSNLPLVAAQCNRHSFSPPAPGVLATAPTTPPAAQSESVADQLTKLANLRDRGVLTQAEFDAQKAKLLAQ